jgi:hypothetical protein
MREPITKDNETIASVEPWRKRFVLISASVLFITGSLKILSAFGTQQILDVSDPFFLIPFRKLLFGVGALELSIATFCVFSRNWNMKSNLIAWLTANFMLYRFGLWFIGWERPCHCLGYFFDTFHVTQGLTDMLAKVIFAWLLSGSCFFVGIDIVKKRLSHGRTKSPL